MVCRKHTIFITFYLSPLAYRLILLFPLPSKGRPGGVNYLLNSANTIAVAMPTFRLSEVIASAG